MNEELLEAIRIVVREEISGVKTDVSGLKEDVSGLKEDVSGLKEDVNVLKIDVGNIKGQLEENTRILRALEHNSQIHKAEIDNIKYEIAKISGNDEKIKNLESEFKTHEHEIILKTDKTNISTV